MANNINCSKSNSEHNFRPPSGTTLGRSLRLLGAGLRRAYDLSKCAALSMFVCSKYVKYRCACARTRSNINNNNSTVSCCQLQQLFSPYSPANNICVVVFAAAACGKCVNRVAIYAPLVAPLWLPPPQKHYQAVNCDFSSSTMNHVAAMAPLLLHSYVCLLHDLHLSLASCAARNLKLTHYGFAYAFSLVGRCCCSSEALQQSSTFGCTKIACCRQQTPLAVCYKCEQFIMLCRSHTVALHLCV